MVKLLIRVMKRIREQWDAALMGVTILGYSLQSFFGSALPGLRLYPNQVYIVVLLSEMILTSALALIGVIIGSYRQAMFGFALIAAALMVGFILGVLQDGLTAGDYGVLAGAVGCMSVYRNLNTRHIGLQAITAIKKELKLPRGFRNGEDTDE